MKIAICPGSFDPITNGHLDIIERSAKLFDRIIVVVLTNTEKNTTFSLTERRDLIERCVSHIPNVEVDCFGGLLVDYAQKRGACALVKGLRAISDFEYEFQMALTNKILDPNIETLYMNTQSEYMYLSSSIVKQVAKLGGSIERFVPAEVHDIVCSRLKEGAK